MHGTCGPQSVERPRFSNAACRNLCGAPRRRKRAKKRAAGPDRNLRARVAGMRGGPWGYGIPRGHEGSGGPPRKISVELNVNRKLTFKVLFLPETQFKGLINLTPCV